MSKKIFIKTFGCQMNEYDSNRIYDLAATIGFNKTEEKNQPLFLYQFFYNQLSKLNHKYDLNHIHSFDIQKF